MHDPDLQFDAYLDGNLTPERVAAFEQMKSANTSMTRQIDAARRIDAELCRLFAPPEPSALVASLALVALDPGAEGAAVAAAARSFPAPLVGGAEAAADAGRLPADVGNRVHPAKPAGAGPRRLGIGRLLAPFSGTGFGARSLRVGVTCALIAIAVVIYSLDSEEPSFENPLAREYHRQIETGFTPAIVCTTAEAFAEWTSTAFGQPMRPDHLTSGVSLLGWSTSNLVPGYAGLLLAKVDGRSVMVVMDQPVDFEERPRGTMGELNTFQRRIGRVRLIEVTPLDRASVVDSIQAAPSRPSADGDDKEVAPPAPPAAPPEPLPPN